MLNRHDLRISTLHPIILLVSFELYLDAPSKSYTWQHTRLLHSILELGIRDLESYTAEYLTLLSSYELSLCRLGKDLILQSSHLGFRFICFTGQE